MISKERLEELIEQKKSIYWKFAKIKPSSWSKYTIMGNTIVKGNLKEIYSLDDLFETKEDFEWHREFGCIERTERLVLPTWETFRVIGGFAFYDYKHNLISMMICLDPVNVAPCNDCIYIADNKNEYFCMPKTQENYTLACRKAKELFLNGGNNDTN